MHNQAITLQHDVSAIQIPSGDSIVLPAGLEVWITQTLGGSYTLSTEQGLVRINASDASALGIHPGDSLGIDSRNKEDLSLEEHVWDLLKGVFDPEIPVNIVDLGLVYDCVLEPSKTQEGKFSCNVKMTLTAPGCGMGPVIAEDARQRILMLDEIAEADVEIVWEPVWNQDMISEEGKMKLGIM